MTLFYAFIFILYRFKRDNEFNFRVFEKDYKYILINVKDK